MSPAAADANTASDAGGTRGRGRPTVAEPAGGAAVPAPAVQGGTNYVGDQYRNEYRPRRSTNVFINVNTGPTYYAPAPVYVAPAYGYAYGGHPVHYHPYWHCPRPVYAYHYAPVYYAPVYYAPVYYSPIYRPVYPVYVEPVTYATTSFAFGFSSFGGGSFTSFSFAHSSARYGAAYGWCPRPAYIYTPVVETYYRSVWIPGYYTTVEERVWIPGRYVERVRTPVVETMYDPFGNSYEIVVEAGSVDYVWESGHYAYESRRAWTAGRWDSVAVF